MFKSCVTIVRSRPSAFVSVSRAESTSIPQNPKTLTSGRPQSWRTPIYVGPHVHPLLKGADYSVVDGPKPFANTFVEAQRLNEQYHIGKQIVQALTELKTAEQLYAAKCNENDQISAEQTKWTPKAKATEEVF